MQTKQPLISVIINNYNYARFLPDAILSVLRQDFTDYELIVVDDASTDHSSEVIKTYGDKVKPIFLKKNCGQGAAFNAGFAAATGDLIVFLDADDIFFETKLSRLASAYVEHQRADLIYHQGIAVNNDFKKLGLILKGKCLKGNIRKRVLKTSESLLPPTSFLSFRRRFLEKVMPLDAFLARIDADFPLQMFACLLGEIAYIDEPLAYYRLHGDNWFCNIDFVKLDLATLHRFTRRTEKSFFYINLKLATLGVNDRLELRRHRFHLRNLFIFKRIGWIEFLCHALVNPNFNDWREQVDYVIFGINRRRLMETQHG